MQSFEMDWAATRTDTDGDRFGAMTRRQRVISPTVCVLRCVCCLAFVWFVVTSAAAAAAGVGRRRMAARRSEVCLVSSLPTAWRRSLAPAHPPHCCVVVLN
jgi:hypothetical protein